MTLDWVVVALAGLAGIAIGGGVAAFWVKGVFEAKARATVQALMAGEPVPEWAEPVENALRDSAQNMRSAMEQLNDARQHATQTQQQLDETLQLSQMKAQQLAGSCESLMQLAQSLDGVSRVAGETFEFAQANRDDSSTQREALNEAVNQVRRISGSTSQALQEIQALDTRSEKIQSVTRVINDIAEQTGLLSLNAAIEAARAGEQGRGFAVVADEVRNLAGRTSHATEEVNSIVEEMARGTRAVVEQIGRLSSEVEDGSSRIEAIEGSLMTIGNRASEVGDRLQQLMNEIQAQVTHVKSTCTDLEQIRG